MKDKDSKDKPGSHDSVLDPSVEPTLIEVEDPLVGKTVGRYQILEYVAKGGTGTVYRALDTVLNREVAVKLLHEHLESKREIGERFKKEAMLIAQMRHPNILTVFDLLDYQGRAALVVEFMPGITLSTLIKQTERVPEDYVFMLASEILQGLKAAHEKGIIHRDIKPANVLLHPDLGVKISDFGLAKVVTHDDGLTKQGIFVGTPSFSSPEQIEGRAVDQRTDIFSLGLTLYILATRAHAFKQKGDSTTTVWFKIVKGKFEAARNIDPTLSPDFERIINKALQVDTAKRYANATAMLADVEEVLKKRGLAPYASKLRDYLKSPEKFLQPSGPAVKATTFGRLMMGVGVVIALGLGALWWMKEDTLKNLEQASETEVATPTPTMDPQVEKSVEEPAVPVVEPEVAETDATDPVPEAVPVPAPTKPNPKVTSVPKIVDVPVPTALNLPKRAVVIAESLKNVPGYRWSWNQPAKFDLATNAQFKNPVVTSAKQVQAREIGTLGLGKYFWRAGAESGSLVIQTSSDYKKISWPTRRAVTVLSRFDDVELQINPWNQELRLDWSAGPSAGSFKLEVATDESFKNLLFSGSLVEKSYKIQRQWTKNQSVYWRVSYQDEKGNVFLVDPIRKINLKVEGHLGVFSVLEAQGAPSANLSVSATGNGSQAVKCGTIGKSGMMLKWTELKRGSTSYSGSIPQDDESRWLICESQSTFWIKPLRR